MYSKTQKWAYLFDAEAESQSLAVFSFSLTNSSAAPESPTQGTSELLVTSIPGFLHPNNS